MQTKDRSTGGGRVGRLALEELEERIAPAGVVFAEVRDGNLFMEGDELDNDIIIDQAGLADGQFRISSGGDTTEINGAAGPLILDGVTKGLRADLGGGSDVLNLNGVDFAANAHIKGGDGDNQILFNGGSLDRSLIVKNDDGYDILSLNGTTVSRNVIVNNGDGGSDLHFSGTFDGNVVIKNGVGDDIFFAEDAWFGRHLNINNGVGDTSTGFYDTDVLRNITIKNSDGVDRFDVDFSTVFGRVNINNGHGDTFTEVVEDVEILGAFNLKNGDGADEFVMENSVIEGSLKIVNGNGNSTTDIGDSEVGLSWLSPRVFDLKVKSGTGTDQVTLWYSEVGRHVKINNGHGGSLNVISDTYIDGNLTGRSLDGVDEWVIELTGIMGRTSINTGNDNDGLWVDDSFFSAKATFNVGAGNDFIALDTETDPAFDSPTVFGSSAALLGGSGDDEFYIGAFDEPGAYVVFTGRVLANGGPGYDIMDVELNDNEFYGPSRAVGIEYIS